MPKEKRDETRDGTKRGKANALQNGKTPGPDDFPVEFYKAFASKLAPLVWKMFKNSLKNAKLPVFSSLCFF